MEKGLLSQQTRGNMEKRLLSQQTRGNMEKRLLSQQARGTVEDKGCYRNKAEASAENMMERARKRATR